MNALHEIIVSEIQQHGWMSFARFMELALYHPEHGYYEKEHATVGREGDFYTSISVGSLFGELLAFQFSEWLSSMSQETENAPSKPTPLVEPSHRTTGNGLQTTSHHIIECGAHDGQLAFDILSWMQKQRPTLFRQLEYRIIESSTHSESLQRSRLAEFSGTVDWISDWADLPAGGVRGVVFSNELLDAFPVHRVGWNSTQKTWFEWGIGLEKEAFVWRKANLKQIGDDRALRRIGEMNLPGALLDILPDHFTTEVNIGAEAWWKSAATALYHGKLLTLDYGFRTEQFFSPERANGTLRAYRDHRIANDPLANPGCQDLTAHVNFSFLESIAEKAGLQTEEFCSQSNFLTRIASEAWKPERDFGLWTPKHTRQFQTLTHPDHLGRSFKVLVQSR